MAFTALDVKKLREMTNVGMMDCKKALQATDGDMDKAVDWLREKGLAKAAKKADRVAAEGVAYATVVNGTGVIIEVNSETDFAAKTDSGEGKREKNEIGISALRMGGVVGIHEVHICTQNQMLTLRHEAMDRGMLADGGVAAARFLAGRSAGLYNMENILEG